MDQSATPTSTQESSVSPSLQGPPQTGAPFFAREELCRPLIEELFPLLNEHYQEIAQFHDIPLAPDLGKYEAVHRDGKLRIFTARMGGVLVGYAVFVVAPGLHYSGSLQATQDILFLHPNYRGHKIGTYLIAFCDGMLQREGVQVVAHHVKVAHPKLGEVLQAQGYDMAEVLWVKRLDLPTFPVPTHRVGE